MGVKAEQPKTWGGSSQKLGRIDRVWGGRGADRLWGGSTGTRPVSRALPATAQNTIITAIHVDQCWGDDYVTTTSSIVDDKVSWMSLSSHHDVHDTVSSTTTTTMTSSITSSWTMLS